MEKFDDFIGKRFGKLVVVAESEPIWHKQKSTNGKTYDLKRINYRCECDCGNFKDVEKHNLIYGNTKSCGCLKNKGRDISLKEQYKEGTQLGVIASKKLLTNNKSGVKGVFYYKKKDLWVANMVFKGKRVLQAYFHEKQDAIDARKEAEEKYFKPILEKYGKTL